MSRHARARLNDITLACDAISRYVDRADSNDEIVFDAIRLRLLEIGEAVKDLGPEMFSTEPGVPWREIARMRDHLAHRYFDTAHAVVNATARDDIPLLAAATERLLAGIDEN
ncbi:HepT-like ribonuclease domain-containing protein [Microbacterium sp. SA39]|uniref:HepT-like ribonuclease domain-containing protein n=1 Tax=Microbacterium sp. SA39 TaxID=1263625 RepID=UPI0005F9B83C|nr:HepT-like ribonuclease domain-containing protein [Microbacterium sp. SA39]KJQ56053.1 hypothetical protein RS85_00114 [Microbacterium sp. SA39]